MYDHCSKGVLRVRRPPPGQLGDPSMTSALVWICCVSWIHKWQKGGIDTYVAVVLGFDGMESLFGFAH